VTRAVFFDWFNTLALFDPPREALHSQAFLETGINVPPGELRRGLLVADRGWFEENARSRVEERGPEEQLEIGIRYEETVLAGAGIKTDREALLKVLKQMQRLYKGVTFILFEDVLKVLKTLKQQGLILGLLTNVNEDMDAICRRLNLEPYLNFVVTSREVGADKPSPPIFLAALEHAGVDASEAVHVGDQYKMDVVGARGVGISPILIDRYNLYPEVTDCPRIRALSEIEKYLYPSP